MKPIDRIMKIMKDKKITAKRICDATGINASSFTGWKKGEYEPSYGSLVKIAKFLDVSPEFLQTGEMVKKESSSADLTEEDDEIDVRKLNFALSGEVHDLSDEEVQEIVSFAKFMRQQRRLRDQNKSGGGDKKDG